jgi:hypothetical protein
MTFLKSQQSGISGNPHGHEMPRGVHRTGVAMLVGGGQRLPGEPGADAIGSGTDVARKLGHLVLFENDLRAVF